jgi:hypothetical protein
MKKWNGLVALIFASLFFTASCGNEAQNNTDEPQDQEDTTAVEDTLSNVEPEPEEEKVEFDRKYNDIARILAGMAIEEDSKYYSVTESATWQAYAKASDAGWASADKRRFNTMREWAAQELKSVREMDSDIFYPFSGPDIYYSYQFFPNAKRYHLFALEPAGDLSFLEGENVNWTEECNRIQYTIDDFIRGGFFHTKHMKVDMKKSGVLPTLLVFLVRSGNTVINVRPVEIQEDGTVEVVEGGDFSSVRIDFLDATTQKQKTVFYHSCDISDAGFVARPQLLKHIQTVSKNRTFTKSASYLMHRPTFAKVRETIIANALAVFQDDTAIPYQYYNDSDWNFTFFGKYTTPIPLFQVRFQKQLREVYQTKEIKDLPFTLGYHSTRDNDNMMLAVRK